MRSRTASWVLATVGLGLVLAACSTTAAGSATSLPGLTSSKDSVLGTPQQSVATAPSTVFTTVTPSATTAPLRSAASTSSGTVADEEPSTYLPPPQDQASIGGWVANFSNGVKFLGWTVTGDTVAGTYSETLLLPAATTLTTDSASFNGTISGSSVTLTFSGGFGSTVSGELVGDTLSLSIPQTDGTLQVEVYHPGTTADYNAGVQIVRASAAQRQDEAASNASIASAVAASNAAAAAAQHQAAADQQSEQSAIASLTQDANFGSDLSSLAGDVKQTAADLAQTRSDAKAGAGDNCVNASSTVYNDAATTIFNDAQTSLYNDLNSLTRDIATTQKAMNDVQSADQQLSTDGVPVVADSASSISAAQGAIAAAKLTANADIDKINKAVTVAYAVANSVATGPCSNMGPGDPPTPIPHI